MATGIRSAGQNISHVLRHKTVHNHVQAATGFFPESPEFSPRPQNSLQIHFNIIPQPVPRPQRWPLPLGVLRPEFCESNFNAERSTAQTAYPKLPSIYEGRLFQTQSCNGDNKYTAYEFIVINAITKL
jgi:hypothetical protein